jgi:F-type H+-transporting ATPase subunit a
VSTATNITAIADKGEALRHYIIDHVMYRTTHIDQWNVPFGHLGFLDVFRSDTVMLFVAAVALVGLAWIARRRTGDVPTGLGNAFEALAVFVRDHIAIPFLGPTDGRAMTPLFCTFFTFIACLNLLGLIPLFSSATGNINVTGGLATITFGFMVFGAIRRHGIAGFVRSLSPRGVPWPMRPFFMMIELVSLVSKAFALTVRLFANMLAGHIVIFALLGLVVVLGWGALPVVALTISMFFFEIFVCLFQAYVFTLLSAVFIGQAYHPEHQE